MFVKLILLNVLYMLSDLNLTTLASSHLDLFSRFGMPKVDFHLILFRSLSLNAVIVLLYIVLIYVSFSV